LSVLAGLLTPDSGFVKLDSKDITSLPVERREVALVTPLSYIPHLEVSKHLVWGAKLKGREEMMDESLLTEVRRRLGINYAGKLAKLSLGMRERVSLATALLSRPRAILVDETFSNIDDGEEFIRAYSDLARRFSIDVLFTTQYLEDSKLADHHYVMELGRSSRKF
jgi:molybdate/tungstate transport system ATP-binding protein